ncbi:hypothetical protein ACFFLM_08720 [Deinococcus oregonensis]|uniref:Uncharacterized protein n=1 Tax=Deinococcus oregonensis TaxID=1805970 RepID=A0ABV6AX19_9DEIO
MTLTVELRGAVIPGKICLELVATNNTASPIEIRGAGLEMPSGNHFALANSPVFDTIWSHNTPALLQPGEKFSVIVPISSVREVLEEEGTPIPATVQARFHNKHGVYLSQPPMPIDFSL